MLRAQAIRVKPLFGPAHPVLTEVIRNRAGTLYALQDQAAKSAVYDQQVLDLDEAALGPSHPDVGRDLGNLCSTPLHLHEDARALPECASARSRSTKGGARPESSPPRVPAPRHGAGC